jgi:DNA-binding CsgD family transcriptional regulator
MPMLHQREFLFHLRPLVLETTASAAPESPPNWEAVTAALAPLSATERQAAWLETFGYNAAQTAVLMRMAPDTVAALRTRSAELLRGGLDDWAAGMLRTHGRSLGAAIEASAPPAEPLEFRHFLDVIDGRITWARRTQFERALEASWHEVHKACAIREVDQALSHPHPLADPQRYFDVLGVAKPKAGFLERLARRALHS